MPITTVSERFQSPTCDYLQAKIECCFGFDPDHPSERHTSPKREPKRIVEQTKGSQEVGALQSLLKLTEFNSRNVYNRTFTERAHGRLRAKSVGKTQRPSVLPPEASKPKGKT